MKRALADRIADDRVHVLDGAMGTMLYSKGVFVNVCYDELCSSRPEVVREIHEEYVRAGAEIIETNTFGANPVKLSSYGLDGRTEEINRDGARLARSVAGESVCVVGAMGPLGIRIEPFGPTAREEAEEFFRRQAAGLLDGGVEGFILETFTDLDEVTAAIRGVRSVSQLPVIAQMTVGEDGKTAYGTDVERIAVALTELGADVIGLNCAVGPANMLDAIERMAEVTDRPLAAQPNAGLPRDVGDRKIYLSSPDYIANYAKRLIGAGTRFVGGCCGTTPEHIKKIRDLVATLQPRQVTVVVKRDEVAPAPDVTAAPLAERSSWGRKLAQGHFVASVEVSPPRGAAPDELVAKATALKSAHVDAVSILDGPRAQSRMSALAAAIILQRDVGVETIIHYTCRDRNMLGMMSDLLGAAAAGLRNILIVTGDPPRTGPYPDATAVFDIDSIGLTNVAYRLNHGLDPGGNPIGEPTRYVIGVALNHTAIDTDRELRRLHWKVDAGADFAVTQPIFDPAQLETFIAQASDQLRIPVVGGIWPLLSARNAEFLANEVPGVEVPAGVLRRMRRAQERGAEQAQAEGVAIAREMIEALNGMVQGIHVSAPLGRVEVALEVIGR